MHSIEALLVLLGSGARGELLAKNVGGKPLAQQVKSWIATMPAPALQEVGNKPEDHAKFFEYWKTGGLAQAKKRQ